MLPLALIFAELGGACSIFALAQGTSESTGSLVPDSSVLWMGAGTTALLFVNIVGGFLVVGKMLDLF